MKSKEIYSNRQLYHSLTENTTPKFMLLSVTNMGTLLSTKPVLHGIGGLRLKLPHINYDEGNTMSTFAAKRTRLFKTEHIEGITYSYFQGQESKIAGNRFLIDLRLFMPCMHGPKGNPWNEPNVYLFDPQSHEVYSTANGTFMTMKGTMDPALARSTPFAISKHLYPRLHPTRVFNFGGHRFSRSQIAKYFEVYHDKCFESRGKPAKAIDQQVADLFAAKPIAVPAVAHKNQGKVTKGNQIIGKIVQVAGSETIEFSANPKIHSDPAAVKTELARLANAYPGERFVSVVIDLTVVKVALDWS